MPIGMLQTNIKELSPAYFALVMATGIISIAAWIEGMKILAEAMFFLNVLYFIALIVLVVIRWLRYRKHVLGDFRDYQKAPGFFTLVAALCIIGNQLVLFYGAFALAKIMLAVAGLLWLGLGYGFFYNITITQNKKPINEGVNGTWLVFIVAIQALSVLISFIAKDFGPGAYFFLFVGLCLFMLGCIFYLYFMSLIIYRMSFFSFNALDLGAPYWINMGATAIITLAGSLLILQTGDFNFIVDILPFIKGFTLFFWAAGTWWIPLLLILGYWRHVTKKVPLPLSAKGYEPSYWGMAFPLGMYAVCTYFLSEALAVDFLKNISDFFVYLALVTWAAISIGFVRRLVSDFGS